MKENSMPKVTVIVPIYNSEKYISECIESILNQTYKNFELFLIDDGSKDASGGICKKYENQDKRIRYIYKENGGVSSARNYGVAMTTGEYVVFVDSDDFIKQDMLERLMRAGNADFVMCGYELFDERNKGITDIFICPCLSGNIHTLAERVELYLYPPFLLGPCCKLFKRRIIVKHKIEFPLDISYGEDAVFVLNYLLNCQSVEVIDYVGYSYRKHGKETLSGKFLRDKIDINYRINGLLGRLLEQEEIVERERIVSDRLLESLVLYTKELMSSRLGSAEKYHLFYEKYALYEERLGKPQRMAQRLVIAAGRCILCYPLLYLFVLRQRIVERAVCHSIRERKSCGYSPCGSDESLSM